MEAQKAKQILEAIKNQNFDDVYFNVYGNKGKLWAKEGCITDLDDTKGACNSRLAFNYCEMKDVGCPDCIAELEKVAGGE